MFNSTGTKGFIIDAIDIEQKSPKPYRISSEGLEYIRTYVPKEVKERKPSNKPCKQRAKENQCMRILIVMN